MNSPMLRKPPILVAERPRIPDDEYAERLRRVEELIDRQGLDALVVYGDDRAVMGAGSVRWLVDYYPHFEPIAVLIAPGRTPIAITGPESVSYIESSSRFRGDLVVTREFVHPDEEYAFMTVRELSSVLDELVRKDVGAPVRLGIVGSDIITPALNEAIRALATEVVAVDKAFTLLRARKSPAELEVIRYAYGIAQQGVQAAIDAIASGGATERDIGAEIDYVLRRWGAEGAGIDTIVAAGREHTYPILHRTSNRMIEEGDSVILTVAPRYEGYHGAIGRTLLVGDVDPRIAAARAVAIEAQAATAEALRPGATAADVDRTAREVVAREGYGEFFLYSGIHSIGVVEFEAPILSGFGDTEVEADMVFSIDIPMFHTPWGGLRVEDGFHVTDAGAVPLQTIPAVLDVR